MNAILHPFLQSVICLGLLLAGFPTASRGQVSTDGSVGPQTTLTGPNYTIGHELGEIRGGNLLHSFHDFNINTRERATFSGPSAIDNIISRVTGGSPSFIDGTLQSDIVGANLFLLNPNGLLFGTEAVLNITGSFHASTADALRFADGETWLTGTPSAGGLSVATPAAFGFLGAHPAGIAIEGSITVPEGKDISLIGGDLAIAGGHLIAPRGRIQLTSLGAPGEVPSLSADASATLDLDTFARMGDIRVTDEAIIDTTGEGGGTVMIHGGNLIIDNAFVKAETRGRGSGGAIDVAVTDRVAIIGNQSGLSTTTQDARGDAGDIRLIAATVEVRDNARIQSRNRDGSGDAGTVVMEVGELTITDSGQISASARGGRGDAGTVTITATDRVTIVGDNSALSVDSSGRGRAGRIMLTAPTITLRDKGRIRARSDHRRAAAGTIQVNAQRLEIIEGGQIDASALDQNSEEQAGEIVISADSLLISGPDSGVASATRGHGKAGQIHIDTRILELTGGAQISAAALFDSNGSAGTVHIVATDRVLITGDGMPGRLPLKVTNVAQDEGVSAGTWGAGNAGEVTIEAPTVEMSGRALIHARSRAETSGNAGTVKLQVGQLTLMDRAQISASSQSEGGDAGQLNINAAGSIRIRGTGRDDDFDFTGFSISNRGDQSGGVMTVTTPRLRLDDAGQLRSQPNDVGGGGRIEVRVDRLQLTGGGQISNVTRRGKPYRRRGDRRHRERKHHDFRREKRHHEHHPGRR